MPKEESGLLKQINSEIENFKTKQVQIVPGLSYNQYDTINRSIFYYNSRFSDVTYKNGLDAIDEDGDRMYFENINKNPCKVFSKAIDFDTKNIRLLTVGGGNPLKTWFMERDLKFWMRSQQFGKTLNRIFYELPILGSVVLKIINGKPYFVDLRNFVCQQGADTLKTSSYIIEIHNYTPTEFRRVAKEMKWSSEAVDKVITEFRKMKDTSHIRVFERYGEVENDGKWTYKKVYLADVGVDEFDQATRMVIEHPGVTLSSEEFDPETIPYREFHAEKMAGRWLGIGVVETLFEPQIRINEIANLQTKTSYWSALRLFFSRDPKMAGNLATEKKNGDVITGDDPITQIDMSDRNLAYFNDEYTKWMKNRDEMTFSYDVVQGERLPAGTPLGSAQIATSQTLSYFEQIQENVAMDVKDMIYNDVLPKFKNENRPEHTLRLVGQDLDQYISMVKDQLVFKEITKLAIQSLAGKPFPTNQDMDTIGVAVEAAIKQGKEKILTVPKGFYDDIKYDIDIDITGESVDTRVRYATKFALLQAITADPTMTTDPVKRKFLYSMAEDGGINPNDFFEVPKKGIEELVPPEIGRAGGGISAPALQNTIPGVNTKSI